MMIKMLELCDKDFEIAMIKLLNEKLQKIPEMNEKYSLSKEIECLNSIQ